jgi:polysaccharide pyruvyl transferase WcaK-like protein
MNPEDTRIRHGIPVFPIRSFQWGIGYGAKASAPQRKGFLRALWNKAARKASGVFREIGFWVSSFRRLREFDLLVVSGGGQLTERGGPWSFPYALFVWAWMAKLVGVRFVVLSVGAGPLRTPLSKFFIASALSAAEYVSFRDEPSRELAIQVGYRGPGKVFPDCAYGSGLEPPAAAVLTSKKVVVGVAPMMYPYCDPRDFESKDLKGIYDDYQAKFSAFTCDLVDRSYSVQMFGSDLGSDPEAIEDLRNLISKNRDDISLPTAHVDSLQSLLVAMAGMDIVVTCRYHGVVLAHLLNKPVLAVAHHRKVISLMDSLGLSEYCVDIKSFDAAQLTRKFNLLVEHYPEVKAQMSTVLKDFQRLAASQYDALFCPVPNDQTSIAQPPPREPASGTICTTEH